MILACAFLRHLCSLQLCVRDKMGDMGKNPEINAKELFLLIYIWKLMYS